MRLSVFLALVLATFVATCISFTSAENVAQISDVDGGNSRKLAKTEEWWATTDDNGEERNLDGAKKFLNRLQGQVAAKKAAIAAGKGVQTTKLSDEQFKTITKEVATNVKKNRKAWPIIKSGLKILYGSLLAALIIVAVDAMIYQKN